MLKIINSLKSRFSFAFVQIISLLSPLAYFALSKKNPTGISLFIMSLIASGLLALVIVLYIFELIFPNFRISQKEIESRIYNIFLFTLFPITAIVIGIIIIPVLIDLSSIVVLPFLK